MTTPDIYDHIANELATALNLNHERIGPRGYRWHNNTHNLHVAINHGTTLTIWTTHHSSYPLPPPRRYYLEDPQLIEKLKDLLEHEQAWFITS